ncbi:hypothetical protein CZ774_14875 [Frigoribacterium sp. JB110]|nr:hypothetical protein CZ774_14875 [Frigoribacterium sp. JB110]
MKHDKVRIVRMTELDLSRRAQQSSGSQCARSAGSGQRA